MNLITIKAIFTNEGKDFIKNMERIVLFLIYPIVAIVMTEAINVDGVQPRFFVATFATMHALFSPIVACSTMVAEEKEKKTLRELMLANVSTTEYLVSVGSFVLLCTMITAIPFVLIGNYSVAEGIGVLVAIFVGSLVSVLLGMSLGIIAKNTVSVNGYAMPVAMILAFGPMLASFNPSIRKVTQFLYGQRISEWIQDTKNVDVAGILVVLVNAVVILGIFCIAFQKSRQDR